MTKDMTEGNALGLILRFALPLLVGNLLQQTYNMIDAAIVGRFSGHAGFWQVLVLPAVFSFWCWVSVPDFAVALVCRWPEISVPINFGRMRKDIFSWCFC